MIERNILKSKIIFIYLVNGEINFYDVNKKYLALNLKNFLKIEIYNINEKEKSNLYTTIRIKFKLNNLNLNQKYEKILLVCLTNEIQLYEINQNNNIENPNFIFNQDSYIISAIFNPFNTHIIASSFLNMIKIWSIRKPTIQKIKCINVAEKMIWEKNGKFLAFNDININVYDKIKKKIIFILDLSSMKNIEKFLINFEFMDNKNIFVSAIEENQILQYNFYDNEKIKYNIKEYTKKYSIEYNNIFIYDYYFIIFNNENKIKIYDEELEECLYDFKELSKNFKIIEHSSKEKMSDILYIKNDYVNLISFKDNFLGNKFDKTKEKVEKKIEIKKEKEEEEEESCESVYESDDNDEEDLNKDYFENCPNNFLDLKEYLKSEFNIFPINYIKKYKKYFEIKEIKEILENNEKKNLLQLRQFVEEELKKKKVFKSIKEEYIYYLKLLIKDETNVTLLKIYLIFLKKNEKILKQENLSYEEFEKELIYYSIFFNKEDIKNLFGKELKSEKQQLLELLKDYLNNIENNNLKNFKKKIKKNNDIKRLFNQPLKTNNKEIIYYACKKTLIYDILYLKLKYKEKIENKKYLMKEILNHNLIGKLESDDELFSLFSFITFPEDKIICDFFLNMIQSKRYSKDELKEKLEKLGFEPKKIFYTYLNPEELCIENINNENYETYEKYNFNYLKKNTPLKLNFDKIKEFLIDVFSCNVFKEAFELITGNKYYFTIFNKEFITELVNNVKFLPLNYTKIVAFTDIHFLTTYISTMKKKIYYEGQIKPNDLIIQTLENSVIIGIEFHEYGHIFNSIISFIDNKLKPEHTPRKRYLKIKEGGYYLELALFGKIIKNLTYKESLYILNANNYNKTLDDFKAGFETLSKNDLRIDGIFNYLNLDFNNSILLNREIYIKAKPDNNINIRIEIPLRNDVRGRTIKEEDLELYF